MRRIYLLILFSFILPLFSFAGFTFTIDTTLVIRQTCDQAYNGEITVAPTGGIAPIMYTIDYGATWQSSPHFTGLGEGIYDVIAEDATGDDATITVNFPLGPSLEVVLSTTSTTCYGGAGGTITINPVNETPPFTYRVTGGTLLDSAFTSNTFAPITVSNLTGELFWIEITDALGCINSQGGITITVPDGDSLQPTTTVTPPTCSGSNNAFINFNFNLGTGPYGMYDTSSTSLLAYINGNNESDGPFTPGTYNMWVQDETMGCRGQFIVVVPDGPIVETPLVEINNQQINITNPQSGVTYSWQQLNNGLWEDVVPAANGTSYAGIQGNQYRVKANISACDSYSASTLFARPVSTNLYGVTTYPNPTRDVLRLTELKLADGWQTAEIISSQGLRILPVNDIRNKTTATFNVAGLGAGVYLVKLTGTDGKTTTLTFIKQ